MWSSKVPVVRGPPKLVANALLYVLLHHHADGVGVSGRVREFCTKYTVPYIAGACGSNLVQHASIVRTDRTAFPESWGLDGAAWPIATCNGET